MSTASHAAGHVWYHRQNSGCDGRWARARRGGGGDSRRGLSIPFAVYLEEVGGSFLICANIWTTELMIDD